MPARCVASVNYYTSGRLCIEEHSEKRPTSPNNSIITKQSSSHFFIIEIKGYSSYIE